MTEEQAKKLHRRALISAKRRGAGESAEDYAQEVLLTFIEGRGRHQTVDQCVIDVDRRVVGRRGSVGYQSRRNLTRPDFGLDVLANQASDPIESDSDLDLTRYRAVFEGRLALVFELCFLQERPQAEVGDLIGVTESRISQLSIAVRKVLHTTLATQDLLERMEWDETARQLVVDWIRL